MSSLRVALVDDSAVVRKHLGDLLTAAGMELVFTASDPLFAWPKLRALRPDVLVLDVEMPRLDGISFLRQVMAEQPMPVVMCSTLTTRGAETTMQAMAAGAVAFVTKPKLGLRDFMADKSNGLVEAVRAAARSNVRALPAVAAMPAASVAPSSPLPAAAPGAMAATTDRVIAVGASTGGIQTFEALLRALPPDLPAGLLLVQHIPAGFSASLAGRLATVTPFDVREATDGERLLPGRVLIAPGGRHMQLTRSGAQYQVEVRDGPLIGHHKPSVDLMFRSVARCAGRNAIGLLLTGMGEDGARGLLALREAGAPTIAQDEASSVVYGMPRAAAQLGAAAEILGLTQIAPALLRLLKSGGG